MKQFIINKMKKKIVFLVLIMIIFQFIMAKPVKAGDDEFGGKLLSPVVSLVVSLGDACVGIIHQYVMGQSQSLIPVDMKTSWWDHFGGWVIGILAGIAAIALVVATCGLAAFALAAVRDYSYSFCRRRNNYNRSSCRHCCWSVV